LACLEALSSRHELICTSVGPVPLSSTSVNLIRSNEGTGDNGRYQGANVCLALRWL
jgi:hypothetical protein